MPRDVLFLALCWACTLSSTTLLITVGPLCARNQGASDAAAPFAVGAFLVGAAVISVPSADLFARYGRRNVFLLGCVFNLVASGLGIAAVLLHNVVLVFCATFSAGLQQGLGQFYRFAAMEVCAPDKKPKAVTLVLTGGVIAAFVGPEVGLRTAMILGKDDEYLASFIAVGVIGVVNSFLCSLPRYPPPPPAASAALLEAEQGAAPPTPPIRLSTLMLQPRCMLAVSVATLAHTSMVMLMSPLVIAMSNAGFPNELTTITLETHFFSMFAPGFLTGKVIAKLGPPTTSIIGIGIFGGAAAVNLLAPSYTGNAISMALWVVGMALCGLGWNLCFSSGTVMLASCYPPEAAARVQGANDFIIFAIAGIGSFGSGYIYDLSGGNVGQGWHALIFCVLGILGLLIGLLLVLTFALRKPSPALPMASAFGSDRDGTSMAIEPGPPSMMDPAMLASASHGLGRISRDNSVLSVFSAVSGSASRVDLRRASFSSEAVFFVSVDDESISGAVEGRD